MNRKLAFLMVFAAVLLLAACGGRASPPAEPAAPPPPGLYGELWRILDTEQLSPEALAALARLEAEHGPALNAYLAGVARDPEAPPLARGQALIRLGDRGAALQIGAFRAALRSPEMRVRAGAVVGLRGLIDEEYEATLRLLERGLEDPDEWVQAKALESLGAADAAVLRRYLAGDPDPELRTIAEGLLRVAEERGQPLADTGAVLTRTSASGARLTFRPTREWPEWDAAVGELIVTPPGGEPVVVSDEVEVVADVVPAFFSPDGKYLVYEAARRIHVRELATGEDRLVGHGIAPRVLPFSSDFVYLRPTDTRMVRGGGSISYDLLRAPFAHSGTSRIGTFDLRTSMEVHGAYSPARWMRVVEADGVFYLSGDDSIIFTLPSPFASSGPAAP